MTTAITIEEIMAARLKRENDLLQENSKKQLRRAVENYKEWIRNDQEEGERLLEERSKDLVRCIEENPQKWVEDHSSVCSYHFNLYDGVSLFFQPIRSGDYDVDLVVEEESSSVSIYLVGYPCGSHEEELSDNAYKTFRGIMREYTKERMKKIDNTFC